MFKHQLYRANSRKTYFHWFLLAFIAGSVNAGGFLGAHRFVSHITGFATLFGSGAARGEWSEAIGILSVPIFFLMGVMVSAYLVDREVDRNRHPHYTLVMSLVCLCLLVAAFGGHFHLFGEFGSEPRIGKDYFFLALLCAASGLQNAAISSASGNTVRTTHLTGVTTDLGTGLVRALSNPEICRKEMKAVVLRVGTIVAFALGSVVASYFFFRFQYLGFLLPAVLAGYSAFESLAPIRRLEKIKSYTMKSTA